MSLNEAIAQLSTGKCAGVFIDDTGSPGLDENSHLHPQRKTWVAVIVPETQVSEVMQQFPLVLEELRVQFGASEFHCCEIFGGRKAFRNVDIHKRLSVFKFLADIFQKFQFPIFVQTLDPDNPVVQHFAEGFPNGVPPFDFRVHADLSLFLLFIRLKQFLQTHRLRSKARLFVDASERFKSGRSIVIPKLDPPFENGEILFADSTLLHPIQLADFAAFALNRSQLLLGRSSLPDIDQALLAILSPLFEGNYRNLKKVYASSHQWPPLSKSELETLFEESRQAGSADNGEPKANKG